MKGLVIFLVLILLPSVYAVEIDIPELFEVSQETVFEPLGKEVYYYAGSNLVASFDGDLSYKYNDRITSDFKSKSLPFGQPTITGNRFSFTGKEKDLDLHYFNARYYDSNLGKFTSVDPVKDNHAYSYVGNRPMNYVDPTGMDGTRDMDLSGYPFPDYNSAPYEGAPIENPGNDARLVLMLTVNPSADHNGAFYGNFVQRLTGINVGVKEIRRTLKNSGYYPISLTFSTKEELFGAIRGSNPELGYARWDGIIIGGHGFPGGIYMGDGKNLYPEDVYNEDISNHILEGGRILLKSCSSASEQCDINMALSFALASNRDVLGLAAPWASALDVDENGILGFKSANPSFLDPHISITRGDSTTVFDDTNIFRLVSARE